MKNNDFIIFSLIFELKIINILRFSKIFYFYEGKATICIQLLLVLILPLIVIDFIMYSCELSVYIGIIEQDEY